MTEIGSELQATDRNGYPASILNRSIRADEDARNLATPARLQAEDIASTLDRVAETRQARAGQDGAEGSGSSRQAALRAREKAAPERRDARELREKWDLPRN